MFTTSIAIKAIAMRAIAIAIILAITISAPGAFAQEESEFKYTSVKAADNIYMLQGRGGNIGLFFGEDGFFFIDDQYANLHEALIAEASRLAGGTEVGADNTILLNTHVHNDHTNGNELMGKRGAVIMAQENVRQRLSVERSVPFFNSQHPPMAPAGLPVLTFSSDISLHLNGDSINVFHPGPAHTDGDAVIHFTRANVIHTGDIVFMQTYPFIDMDNGGSVQGVISAVEKIMALADDDTKIIPGHGQMTNLAELKDYHEMLVTLSGRISKMAADGMTLEQVQQAKPTADYDERYNGFIDGEAFIGLLYRDLSI